MSLSINVLKKDSVSNKYKITCPSDIIKLDEIQEIRNAYQEYFFFIGLDRANNLRTISLLGIGPSNGININSRDIVRTALITNSERIILVHNHPANSLKPSLEDLNLTNQINKVIKVFNIELLDHIIVTEDKYASMKKLEVIDKNYTNKNIEMMEKALLLEENKKLKQELQNYKQKQLEEDEEELEE